MNNLPLNASECVFARVIIWFLYATSSTLTFLFSLTQLQSLLPHFDFI